MLATQGDLSDIFNNFAKYSIKIVVFKKFILIFAIIFKFTKICPKCENKKVHYLVHSQRVRPTENPLAGEFLKNISQKQRKVAIFKKIS